MNRILESVRQPLLFEAQSSPNLLADLAGLERYIAESYSSRSFIELLQNADDAISSRLKIQKIKNYIVVANDGREITVQDFEALCRSAASQKERNSNIGYRGIGFKSVVHFADSVHIFSGELEATFSRELTRLVVPNVENVPLIRIPHEINQSVRNDLTLTINALKSEGFKTIFVFSNLVGQLVESEFEGIDPTAILFLRNLSEIIIGDNQESKIICIEREKIDDVTLRAILRHGSNSCRWLIFQGQNASIALPEFEDVIKQDPSDAVVHAFLPTIEVTGFGVKVNGNISTDPSRTKVIYDDITISTIKELGKIYVNILESYFLIQEPSEDQCRKMSVLAPMFDPRMLGLQKKSFRTYFIEAIKSEFSSRTSNYFYKPKWMNSIDFELLTHGSNEKIISPKFSSIEGIEPLIQYLGIQYATLEFLSPLLSTRAVSIQGASEIVSYLSKQYSIKRIGIENISLNWKIWSVKKAIISMHEVIKSSEKFDNDFVDLIVEKNGVGNDLRRLVAGISSSEVSDKILPKTESVSYTPLTVVSHKSDFEKTERLPNGNLSLVKWRSAEQQIFDLFNKKGWSAIDVSRQNVGYDIEATSIDGRKYYIEVKSLNFKGQEFTLTSNEEATAREKGTSYIIALVLQQNDELSVMLIEDPASSLKFERQCKQWVWLCSSYQFNPTNYKLM
ncbi:sacsin N-terminal ATP-binding-like domain-containing protein [Undibacterium sp.]|uniref:sacsin N-terminal ATP-binding-like domain-containing protein n=1 Tax=Undibacterium sp. TaxID=1914977 RepID=UPI0037505662